MDERDEFVATHADVFETVADETRFRILLAMIRRQMASGPLAYSEIMDAVGIEDSGRFNYHLDRLRDHLVREEDGKYVPTPGARMLVSLVATGKLSDDTTVEDVTVGATCLRCGTPLVATYDYDFFVSCHSCGVERFAFPTAPDVAAERPLRTVAHEADRRARAQVRSSIPGPCLRCGHENSVRFTDSRERFYGRELLDVYVDVLCENCFEGFAQFTVGQFLLGHPTVQDYCRERGIDLAERAGWQYAWTRSDRTTEVRSRDPWEIAKYAYADGCRLVAVIEDDGSISHVDHVRVDR